jgi:hypothetical protein
MNWRAAIESLGVTGTAVELVGLAIALVVALLVQLTVGALARRALHRVVGSTRTTWDDALLYAGAFHRVAHALPLGVLYAFQRTFELTGLMGLVVERTVNVLLVVVVAPEKVRRRYASCAPFIAFRSASCLSTKLVVKPLKTSMSVQLEPSVLHAHCWVVKPVAVPEVRVA